MNRVHPRSGRRAVRLADAARVHRRSRARPAHIARFEQGGVASSGSLGGDFVGDHGTRVEEL